MARQHWDLIVVGGGITGAGIARDAAFRGLKVAVLEKGDWSSGTSSATSKLAHGGLRYLKTLEFGLVRESLRERRYLEVIAPHIVYPLPFLVPIYKQKFILTAGMILYDLLSYDKNKLDDPSKRLPHFKMFSRAKTLAVEPGLDARELKGGALYYDCQNLYPDRVGLEFIRDAVLHGAAAANYAKVTRLVIEDNTTRGVEVRDELNASQTVVLRGKMVINATGPWANLLSNGGGAAFPHGIRRSKGIHLVTRPLTRGHALVLETKDTGRVFFVLPWRGYSIVGTTDVDYNGQPDDVRVTEKDRDDLIRELNEAYPSAALRKEDVLYSYVGIRPLVEEAGKDSTQVSRKYEIYDHERESGVKGLLTIVGGKWTTTRQLAEEVTDRVFAKLDLPPVPCTTIKPVAAANFGLFSDYLAQEIRREDGKASPALIRSLIEIYGSRYREVYEACLNTAGDDEVFTVGDDAYLLGQAADAVKHEMVCRLDDFMRRRTGMGTLGDPSRPAVEKICARMALELGWDAQRQQKEIAYYYDTFDIKP